MWYGSGEVQFCLIGIVYQICKFAQLSLQISSLFCVAISKELLDLQCGMAVVKCSSA